jgi:hypothetical protein
MRVEWELEMRGYFLTTSLPFETLELNTELNYFKERFLRMETLLPLSCHPASETLHPGALGTNQMMHGFLSKAGSTDCPILVDFQMFSRGN